MDHKQMLDFIHKQTKAGLDHIQHFDLGGTALGAGYGAEIGSAVPGIGTAAGAIVGGIAGTFADAKPSFGNAGKQNPWVQNNATNPNVGLTGTIAGALGQTNNFQASSANVNPGTNNDQLTGAYTGAQNALANQQNLVNSVQPGVDQGVASQQALSNQLAAQARGQGPNVAQNQLNQATGTNVANQAALMAGQRGSSQNAGLIARQAAQQGAGIQQNAAGQGATLGAEQQIAAQGAGANLASTQVNQGMNAVQGINNAQQNEQNILQNANTGFNNSIVGMQSNINNVNAATSAQNAKSSGGILGGLSSLSSLFAKGGEVKKYADGGQVTGNPLIPNQLNESGPGPQSFVGQWLNSGPASTSGPNVENTPSFDNSGTTMTRLSKSKSDPMSGATSAVDGGGSFAGGDMGSSMAGAGEMLAAKGGSIGKATKKGDNYADDKIPALLSEGEVVIDRDTLNDKGPIGQMARAIKQHLAQRNGKK